MKWNGKDFGLHLCGRGYIYGHTFLRYVHVFILPSKLSFGGIYLRLQFEQMLMRCWHKFNIEDYKILKNNCNSRKPWGFFCRKNYAKNLVCTIFSGGFTEEVIFCPGKDYYHENCINEWMRSKHSCLLCKRDIKRGLSTSELTPLLHVAWGFITHTVQILLTLIRLLLNACRNHSIDLHCKSVDWFLCECNFGLICVK